MHVVDGLVFLDGHADDCACEVRVQKCCSEGL